MNHRSYWIYLVPLTAVLLVAAGLYLAISTYRPATPSGPEGLLLLSDENLRNPVEMPEIEHESGVIGRFQRRAGVRVQAEYGSSALLMEQLETGIGADLLLADEYQMERAGQSGKVHHVRQIARLVPVILVHRDNPHNITGLSDLAAPEIRLATSDEQNTTMGRIASEILRNNGISWRNPGRPPLITETEAGAAMAVGNRRADAAIVWRPLAGPFSRRTGIIDIPADQNEIIRLKIGVLNRSEHQEQAVRLADFIAGPAGREVFEMYGYEVDSLD